MKPRPDAIPREERKALRGYHPEIPKYLLTLVCRLKFGTAGTTMSTVKLDDRREKQIAVI